MGNARSLEILLNRIFPMRFSEEQNDKTIFLGNYSGSDENGCDVIEMLCQIKQEYQHEVIFLRGSHDQMMLSAILAGEKEFNFWMENGGRSTIAGYLKKMKSDASQYSIGYNRLKDLIPKSHIEFLQHTEHYYIIDEEYCLFNSGFNIKQTIRENNLDNFCFDTTSGRYVKNAIRNKTKMEFLDSYVFVCSANPQGKEPFIHPRYMMLGGTSPERLIALELHSMAMTQVSRNKTRIYKYDYDVIE
jgi:hypothetical protein